MFEVMDGSAARVDELELRVTTVSIMLMYVSQLPAPRSQSATRPQELPA